MVVTLNDVVAESDTDINCQMLAFAVICVYSSPSSHQQVLYVVPQPSYLIDLSECSEKR